MIPASDVTAGLLTSSAWTYRIRVESWLGDQLLATDIPVSGGSEDDDRSLRVPERVTLYVPRVDRGFSWAPEGDDHPLAANGQRIRVMLGVQQGRAGQTEWLQRGWFSIADSRPQGDQVTVTALGMLSLIDEARLVSPFQPAGTIGSTVRALIEPALTVDLTAAPADRSVPAAMNIDEDRLGGVLDLLDAWGADGYVRNDGVFVVVPAGQDTTPGVLISTSNTKIQQIGASTREGAYNVVVARGTAADGGIIQGVAYETTGPKAYGGGFNPLPVPYFYSSPLLTSGEQCNTAAATVLERLRRQNAQRYEVRMVPNPRLQLGDVAQLGDGSLHDPANAIEALHLPFTADGGEASINVRELA